MKHECQGDTNCSWYTRKSLQDLGEGIGEIRNQKDNQNYRGYRIAEIGENTEKSPGDLWGFRN